MSEFETLADLFDPDRHPARELEPIQKVDETDQIERDIEEFYETPSAERVLDATAEIVSGAGASHRFRYVHATFGSGKSHLLKLIGVATGEMTGLEEHAHTLANEFSGFKRFRDALVASRIDHLQPLFMNLLDRDKDDTALPLLLFEELGRRREYPTDWTWLLEFCWRLEVKHDLWAQLKESEHEGLRLEDVVDRPSSLQPWLRRAIPELDGATSEGLESQEAVGEAIADAAAAVKTESFNADDLVERLIRTREYLQQDGDTYQFLIGLDEIAIYVGDQPRRYAEVVETITALIEGLNPPILGTGQWSMRDMQQDFVGEVDENAWYTEAIQLEGADTETIVRKRWLQKSTVGNEFLESEILADVPDIEPAIDDAADITIHDDPAEAYPFRDRDLWVLREAMQGLIKGDRETDREYIQGRALLVRVRSLFAQHGWAERSPGVIVPWDILYDVIDSDTDLIPSWGRNLIERVKNTARGHGTLDVAQASSVAKALLLISQVDSVPGNAENIARLLVDTVSADVDALRDGVEIQLAALASENLIREDSEEEPTTYTILSEREIQFWRQVQEEAPKLPEHQVKSNVIQYLQNADADRLTPPKGTTTRSFDGVKDVPYTIRYTIGGEVPTSPTDRYDAVVIRVAAGKAATLSSERDQWIESNSGPTGKEDVLVSVEVTPAITERVRQLIAMKAVLDSMSNPGPELRLQRQTEEEELEDDIEELLHAGQVYTPRHSSAYGTYLEKLDSVVAEAVGNKYPNRKSVEKPVQMEDLAALIDFFEGKGEWPLADADADMLGVNRVPRTIEDGWVAEFTELFSDDDRVGGERVLETIEGRAGEFLGTPPGALHALLFVLVAADRIEVRTEGERVTNTREIARVITLRSRFEDATIGFDPEPPAEDLDKVYESLLGEEATTDDTSELLEDIGKWATTNASDIRDVATKSTMVFGAKASLSALEEALEAGMSGGELDADLLTNPTIVEQAELYGQISPVLAAATSTQDSLWAEFQDVYELIERLYPNSDLKMRMQPYAKGTKIPDSETLQTLIEEADQHRTEKLQELYELLSSEEIETDDRDSIRDKVTELLVSADIETEIGTLSEKFENLDLTPLESLVEQAESTTEPLAESTLASPEIRSAIEDFAAGPSLLETTAPDGTSLYEQLETLYGSLTVSHAESFVTTQIEHAVSGTKLPSVDRARRLHSQGESLLEDETIIDENSELEQLWQEITTYGDGTVVVLDLEDHE